MSSTPTTPNGHQGWGCRASQSVSRQGRRTATVPGATSRNTRLPAAALALRTALLQARDVAEPRAVPRLGGHRLACILARSGDQILLDDEPAAVAAPGELREERGQIDVAGAELAEDAAAPGFLHVRGVGDHRLEDRPPVVLDVHVV